MIQDNKIDLLEKLKILKASDSDDNTSESASYDLEANDDNPYKNTHCNCLLNVCRTIGHTSNIQPNSISKSLLVNRRFLEGIRGYLTILVIIDHFYYYNKDGNVEIFGHRLLVDTFLFVITSGFTVALQNISLKESDPTKSHWNSKSFLYSRFIGLFPLYWVALLLCIPRIIYFWNTSTHPYNETLSNGNFSFYIILTVIGLQEWTRYALRYIHDVYYVSLIWGVFLVYALCQTTIHHPTLHFYWKVLIWFLINGFLIGMFIYLGNAVINPPWACYFFLLGVIAAYVYNFLRIKIYGTNDYVANNNKINQDDRIITNLLNVSSSHDNVSSMSLSRSKNKVESFDNEVELTQSLSKSNYIKEITTNNNNNITVIGMDYLLQYKYLFYPYLFLPDMISFSITFIIFYNDYPSAIYNGFDMFMYVAGLPLLFCLLLISVLLQPSPKMSIFVWICETYPMVLLGECSLPIYIFQVLIVNYYYEAFVLRLSMS